MNKNMLRIKKTKSTTVHGGDVSPAKPTAAASGGSEAAAVWEMRPGGMLVQKRSSDYNQNCVTISTIKVKVKFGSFLEVKINSQATFGELKKMLSKTTGLQPEDQKLMYKDKERDSRTFLDVAGVKEGSKLVLMEDEMSIEKRLIESRKTAKMEAASKEITVVRLEIDKLAKQVADVEMNVYGGKKVAEKVILNLIETLMTELIKLDAISAEGDVKLQRRMQVKRVQKYIETLDMLKTRNSILENNNNNIRMQFQQQQRIFTGQIMDSAPIHNKQQHNRNLSGGKNPGQVVVTTEWEKF